MVRYVGDGRGKIQFGTSAEMPHMIYLACLKTGIVSNTAYCQQALAEALARDLDVPIEDILENIPPNRGPSQHLYNPADGSMVRPVRMIGPANTIEEVR